MESSVGRRIKTLRERRDWSQRELAQQAGVGRSWLSQVESGDIPNPGGKQLDRVAQALGVTTTFLLRGEGAGQSELKRGLLAELGQYSARQLEQLLHIAHVVFLEESPDHDTDQESRQDGHVDQPEPESEARGQR